MSQSWAGKPAQGPKAAVKAAAPEDGGPRNWEVSGVSRELILRKQPSSRAGAAALVAAGTILDNLGCRKTEGLVWCDVQPLGGGPRGYATVVVTKPDGRTRAIFSRMGRPIGADTSQADPGKFSAAREGDLHLIRIGGERYEIPDAAVLGG
jgi:hypothetical protein